MELNLTLEERKQLIEALEFFIAEQSFASEKDRQKYQDLLTRVELLL